VNAAAPPSLRRLCGAQILLAATGTPSETLEHFCVATAFWG